MKIAKAYLSVFYLLFLVTVLYSQSGTARKAIIVTTTPFYNTPQQELLPSGYLDKGRICIIDSFVSDSMGAIWLHLFSQKH